MAASAAFTLLQQGDKVVTGAVPSITLRRQGDKLVILKKDLLEKNVTCSKCKMVPRNATVAWCSAHHLMCLSCYNRLNCMIIPKYYVQCGADCKVESRPALSAFIANVLKELPTKCKFTQNGCQVSGILKQLEVHEVDCAYRKITCPFLHCNAKNVSSIGLGAHLEAIHGSDMKKIGKAKSKDVIPLSVPNPAKWIPRELAFCNHSFFTEVFYHLNYKYFWIYFHGTPEEAAHYSYRLKIIGGNGNDIIFKGKVTSLDEPSYQMKKDIFLLSDAQINYLQVDGQINFKIKLYSDYFQYQERGST